MIERLAQFVAVRSVSREESALAGLIARQLADARIEVRREGNNIWCEAGDAPRPRLLLNSHLDTVPPGEGWTGDPWTPRRAGDRLIGLGANDAKGCVTAMIETFLAVRRELEQGGRLGGTLVMALTAEEETAGNGLATILDLLGSLDAAVVGEPTGLVPMSAQRGLLILRATAHGRTAHPAHTPPRNAQNAIVAAAEDILRLKEFDWGPCHPRLGQTHGNVTMISGGIAHNVIPDTCEFRLDIRTTPLESHSALYMRLKAHLKSSLSIHSERLVPVETPEDAAIVRAACAAAGRSPEGSPTMSDMVFLHGIPAVKLGPGQSVRSHIPDEFILESELTCGAAVYSKLVRQYFAIQQAAGP
jgi:acetylornithine deacetylase